MKKLLMIADDLTGAMDAGVKFASAGAYTEVRLDPDALFFDADGPEALVICAPTRHLPPAEAYAPVRRISARAAAAGADCIFKKTDSALRGNVGAELGAVLDGAAEMSDTLCFLPALPAAGRVTRGGVQYIGGVPVARSVFGADPFDPVAESDIAALIRRQSPVRIQKAAAGAWPRTGGSPSIRIFDAESDGDIAKSLTAIDKHGRLRLLAGCAGLAGELPRFLGFHAAARRAEHSYDSFTVICGSMNPISVGQLAYAEARGFRRTRIPAELFYEGAGAAGLSTACAGVLSAAAGARSPATRPPAI